MKLVQKPLYFILLFSFLLGCTQSLTSNSTLLSSGSSDGTPTTAVPVEEDGQLEIQADNTDLSASIDDTDKIEITGSCNDLNRKKNRIIVEAFSGENENDTPYVSNAISDYCQQTTVLSGFPSTGNGIPLNSGIGTQCFWVTKGNGVIEDATIPLSKKSFPQCHNGRFSFAVRLGGVLQNPSPSGSRYLVRFKLRSLEGQISESSWARVYVTRKLSVPSIDKVEKNDYDFFCSLKMSPARFNQNILYQLDRQQVGVTPSVSATLFSGWDSASITSGNSVYSYSDDTTRAQNIMSGVTYTYTLSSIDNTVYSDGFVYSPALTQTSSSAECKIANPVIETLAPTNTPITVPGGTGPTCYMNMPSGTSKRINPAILNGTVRVRWAFSQQPGWTGVDGSADISTNPAVFLSTACNIVGGPGCTSTAANDGLQADVTYYFAAQEYDPTIIAPSEFSGRWSNEISCRPPAAP